MARRPRRAFLRRVILRRVIRRARRRNDDAALATSFLCFARRRAFCLVVFLLVFGTPVPSRLHDGRRERPKKPRRRAPAAARRATSAAAAAAAAAPRRKNAPACVSRTGQRVQCAAASGRLFRRRAVRRRRPVRVVRRVSVVASSVSFASNVPRRYGSGIQKSIGRGNGGGAASRRYCVAAPSRPGGPPPPRVSVPASRVCLAQRGDERAAREVSANEAVAPAEGSQ